MAYPGLNPDRRHHGFRRITKALLSGAQILLLAWPLLASQAHALTPPTWHSQTDIPNIFSSPSRVATDLQGNIYVADENLRAVIVLAPSGNQLFSIRNASIPRSVAVDGYGRILVGYMDQIGVGVVAMFDSTGHFLKYLGAGLYEFAYPSDIAVSYSTGRIFVLDSLQNAVKVYDADGGRVAAASGKPLYLGGYGHYDGRSPLSNPGKMDFPTGVAVDDIRGEVLVSDQNNFRVQIFDFNGNFKTAFGKSAPDISWGANSNIVYDFRGVFTAIRGLTVDKEGRIYVTDAFQGHVQVLDRAGNYIAFIGEQGSGTGQLSVPLDVAINRFGRMAIVDWNNNRLTSFQTDAAPAYNNMPPSAVTLLSPADAVQVSSTKPNLSVSNADDINGDALSYEFQADTSPSFTGQSLVSFMAPRGENITSGIAPELIDHTLYYWRARAVETSTPDLFTGAWTEPRMFYVNAANRTPQPPVALAPLAGAGARKTDILCWQAAADPDMYDTILYRVDISDRPDFSAIILSRSWLSGTSAALNSFDQFEPALRSGATYYWRVGAVDNHGAVAFSATNSFVFKQTLLRVASTPAGGSLYLDGNYEYLGVFSGTTEQPVEIKDLRPGRHVVRLIKNGYFGYYASVDVIDGEIANVDAALVAAGRGELTPRGRLQDENGEDIGDATRRPEYTSPFIIDWNNDGRKDLLTGDAGGRVYLYENTATDAAPAFRLSQAYPGGVVVYSGPRAVPFVVDWDNDGRKDLLAGSEDGAVRLYLNQGSDESPLFTGYIYLSSNGAAIETNGNAHPVVADWNNDGKKDLLVGDGAGKIRLFINSGDDSAPSFDSTPEIAQGTNIMANNEDIDVGSNATVTVTDWNLDGKKDVLVGGGHGLRALLNAGTDVSPAFSTHYSHKVVSGIAAIILDYNNDGYSDLLVGEANGGIRYYQFRKAWDTRQSRRGGEQDGPADRGRGR